LKLNKIKIENKELITENENLQKILRKEKDINLDNEEKYQDIIDDHTKEIKKIKEDIFDLEQVCERLRISNANLNYQISINVLENNKVEDLLLKKINSSKVENDKNFDLLFDKIILENKEEEINNEKKGENLVLADDDDEELDKEISELLKKSFIDLGHVRNEIK